MNRILIVFLSALVGVFVIDQNLKALFLDGFRWYGDYFSLILIEQIMLRNKLIIRKL